MGEDTTAMVLEDLIIVDGYPRLVIVHFHHLEDIMAAIVGLVPPGQEPSRHGPEVDPAFLTAVTIPTLRRP